MNLKKNKFLWGLIFFNTLISCLVIILFSASLLLPSSNDDMTEWVKSENTNLRKWITEQIDSNEEFINKANQDNVDFVNKEVDKLYNFVSR